MTTPYLARRALVAGGIAAGAIALLPATARAGGFCDFETFGPDSSGRTPCDAAFRQWILAALQRGQVARAGPGLFRLAASQTFPLAGDALTIVGAGPGRTRFQRVENTVKANGEVLMRFVGTGGGGSVAISGLTVDMNCDAQPAPPGSADLTSNFAWEHCIAVEFLPRAVGAFDTIHIADCEVRDPVSDGFSIRGGPPTGAHVVRALFERVVNARWPIARQRPRVRGDVTITSIITRLEVRDCLLPRLHYEVEMPIPAGTTMTIVENGNGVGELLALFGSNLGTPERVVRTTTGGTIARDIVQGGSVNRATGVRFALRKRSRLTGGSHRFERCAFAVAADYAVADDPGSALFTSYFPAAHDIAFVDCTLDAGARAPHYMVSRSGARSGPGSVAFDGLVAHAPTMQLASVEGVTLAVRRVTSDYAGGGAHGGAFVSVGTARDPVPASVAISDVTLGDPRAALFRGPVVKTPGIAALPVTLARNRIASGRAIDRTSDYGAIAARLMARDGAWYVAGE